MKKLMHSDLSVPPVTQIKKTSMQPAASRSFYLYIQRNILRNQHKFSVVSYRSRNLWTAALSS